MIYIKTIDISLDLVQYDAVWWIIKARFLLRARKPRFILTLLYKKNREFSLVRYIHVSFFPLYVQFRNLNGLHQRSPLCSPEQRVEIPWIIASCVQFELCTACCVVSLASLLRPPIRDFNIIQHERTFDLLLFPLPSPPPRQILFLVQLTFSKTFLPPLPSQ